MNRTSLFRELVCSVRKTTKTKYFSMMSQDFGSPTTAGSDTESEASPIIFIPKTDSLEFLSQIESQYSALTQFTAKEQFTFKEKVPTKDQEPKVPSKVVQPKRASHDIKSIVEKVPQCLNEWTLMQALDVNEMKILLKHNNYTLKSKMTKFQMCQLLIGFLDNIPNKSTAQHGPAELSVPISSTSIIPSSQNCAEMKYQGGMQA